jgi:cell division septation protein DedD
MNDATEGQKELFDDFEPPKRTFPKLGRLFQKGDFAVTLNSEKLIFLSIAMVMAMVIVFALGVEKGREERLATKAMEASAKAAVTQPKPATQVKTAINVLPKNIAVAPAMPARPVTPAAKAAEPVRMPATLDSGKPYTIVAVTFRRKDTALSKAERLKREGLAAFVKESEEFFVVCVGAYASKDAAKSCLSKVKKYYGDAYITLR